MGFPFKDITKCKVTCIYGIKGELWASGKHDGVDLVSSGDKTILAISDGKVIRSSNTGAWGEHVVIQMADGRSVVYAHMIAGSRKVVVGATVKTGQALGIMGNTGNSEGAHLHIEIQKSYYKAGAVDDITEFLKIKNIKGKVQFIKEAEKVEKKTLNIVMPDGKVFPTLAINDNGSNYTQIRPLLEALGYKVGYINGKVTINK